MDAQYLSLNSDLTCNLVRAENTGKAKISSKCILVILGLVFLCLAASISTLVYVVTKEDMYDSKLKQLVKKHKLERLECLGKKFNLSLRFTDLWLDFVDLEARQNETDLKLENAFHQIYKLQAELSEYKTNHHNMTELQSTVGTNESVQIEYIRAQQTQMDQYDHNLKMIWNQLNSTDQKLKIEVNRNHQEHQEALVSLNELGVSIGRCGVELNRTQQKHDIMENSLMQLKHDGDVMRAIQNRSTEAVSQLQRSIDHLAIENYIFDVRLNRSEFETAILTHKISSMAANQNQSVESFHAKQKRSLSTPQMLKTPLMKHNSMVKPNKLSAYFNRTDLRENWIINQKAFRRMTRDVVKKEDTAESHSTQWKLNVQVTPVLSNPYVLPGIVCMQCQFM